jgi:hypothetical protein
VELIRPQAERKIALEDAQNGLVIVKALCVLPTHLLFLACPSKVKNSFE